jgi:hypothetical protein
MPEIFPVSHQLFRKNLHAHLAIQNIPMRIAYKTATAAASVGVKTPPRIPPKMMTAIIMAVVARPITIAVSTSACGKGST